jgi:hypothetical protein
MIVNVFVGTTGMVGFDHSAVIISQKWESREGDFL